MKELALCTCSSNTIEDIHINSSMESDMFAPFSDAFVLQKNTLLTEPKVLTSTDRSKTFLG